MALNQHDPDIFQQNSKYIVLSTIFFILSLAGLFIFFQTKNNKPNIPKINVEPTLIPTIIPTLIEENLPTPTFIETTPTASPTATILVEPTMTATPTPKITIKPSPTLKPVSSKTDSFPNTSSLAIKHTSSVDNFSINYASYRKLYEEKENNGNLYTFYSTKGSFAVHVSNGDWIWTNSGRSFSNGFTINNLPTFRYDTNSQTLVDVENAGKKYTIQCVHNNNSALKFECEDFIKSFRVL